MDQIAKGCFHLGPLWRKIQHIRQVISHSIRAYLKGYGPHVGRQFKGGGVSKSSRRSMHIEKLFNKEGWEQARKTKGQAMTLMIKEE